MENLSTDWTKAEFKAYLLTYTARCNFFESEEEKELIMGYVNQDQYKRIHKEIEHDNDYQSIQKIMFNLEKFNYSKDDLERLMAEIKQFLKSDGNIDAEEQNLLIGLKHLFTR